MLRDYKRGERHAINKFRRAVSTKITVKNRNRCNIVAEFERRKAASKSTAPDETKSL